MKTSFWRVFWWHYNRDPMTGTTSRTRSAMRCFVNQFGTEYETSPSETRQVGTGRTPAYPDAHDRLAGNAIPLSARLVAIADVYDALRSRRLHRPALSHRVAAEMITSSMIGPNRSSDDPRGGSPTRRAWRGKRPPGNPRRQGWTLRGGWAGPYESTAAPTPAVGRWCISRIPVG